ncbi:MAG: hypothetical protein ABJC04_02115 [Verrucomicrobiota bacterium]
MKSPAAKRKSTALRSRQTSSSTVQGKIHPIVIYPFRRSDNYEDLRELYGMVARLADAPDVYARPITVMDRKTFFANADDKKFAAFRRKTVAASSDILDAWCVDTCQMWYSGLGLAFERGDPNDVYWLIPGDFNYGSTVGHEVLSRLHDLPEICHELQQDVCIGEIATDHNNPKQLIDTYGTFALLYHWFPSEGREIREYTERPRSEFFAMRHAFLGQMLNRRWYAYEQTVVTLLHAVFDQKRISRFFVGHVSDLPEGRESLSSAMQQVDRTERVLKTLWRERNQGAADWSKEYRVLEAQSDQVRRIAMNILENLLS